MLGMSIENLLMASLIFIRVSALLFALPLFGDRTNPLRVRILMSVAIAAGIFPLVSPDWGPNFNISLMAFFVLVIKEIVIGFTVGFTAKMMFDGIVVAAGLVGYQMGFGTANLFLPDAEAAPDPFSALHRSIVILLFLSLSLHHIFLKAISETFVLIPAGAAVPNEQLGAFFISITAGVFSIALKLATPMIVALLFTMAALGLIARTVPQMNVFIMSFPVSFFVGLLIYLATIPYFEGFLSQHFYDSGIRIFSAIRGLTP